MLFDDEIGEFIGVVLCPQAQGSSRHVLWDARLNVFTTFDFDSRTWEHDEEYTLDMTDM